MALIVIDQRAVGQYVPFRIGEGPQGKRCLCDAIRAAVQDIARDGAGFGYGVV
ncbi:MAG: hypothetical protein LBB83_04905 [Treponema sp.]|nr:hypothetical protein [Treponema sp.]